jgi:hypothetical protein
MEKIKLKEEEKEEKLIKNFNEEKIIEVHPRNKMLLIIAVVAVVLGIGTGYLLSRPGSMIKEEVKRNVTEEEIKPGVTVGVTDEKSFKDSAEGKLEKGGVDGEGSHHLVRSGGESQNVYLTSSIIDLDKFVGHKVKVWGQTFAAQKAGWLMDVGKLKVLE